MDLLPTILSIVGSILSGIILLFIRKSASKQKTTDENITLLIQHKIKSEILNENTKETLIKINEKLESFQKTQVENYKMDGKLELVLREVYKIPELEKDLRLLGNTVRETRDAVRGIIK